MNENNINPLEADEVTDGLNLPRTPINTNIYLQLRFATDVNLSPDGRQVAFVVRQWIPDQPRMRSRIWLVEASGGEPFPFTRGPKNDYCPRWSPDSQQLAFISTGGSETDKPQPYILSVTGGDARRVCVMPNGISDLSWSPDGSRIAFLSLEGTEPQSDPLEVRPGRHQRLWTIRPGNDIPEPVTPDGLTVWEYAFSPDSRWIAIYYTTGPDETDWYRGQIGIVAAGGGGVRQISHLTRQASSLDWSPDGTRIAYISGEWSDRGLVGGDIFTLSVEGGDARNLTPGIEYSPGWCRWLPDGQRLLYAAWSGVSHLIGVLDENTGKTTILDHDFTIGETSGPRLSPSANMRTFAVTHVTQQHPYDVWLGKISDKASEIDWQRLSRLNPIAEETLKISSTARIRYKSVNNWQIDALFTPPLEYNNTNPPPLVVIVHGGPSAAHVDDFGPFVQMLAAAGYATLRANIRGSQGRGVAFSDAVLGDMGGKDYQDILHGVDYLIGHGLVDESRIAIMGGSYGGFMTAWAVTQTKRFKAAIMIAGLSDFHSFHAQSNIPDWDQRFLGADPLERPDVYRKRSAITYAAQVSTPTLIIHGERDLCVPVNQAYAFYRALLERHVPVELIVYPREGHGLVEHDHIQDYQQRALRWFSRYL